MSVKRIAALTVGILVGLTLLFAIGPGQAQEQGWPINHPTGSSSFPWNSPGYRGYNEPVYATQQIVPTAAATNPQKYESYVNALPMMKNTQEPNAVTLVAHVPENAEVWIGDSRTTSGGTLRTFKSPPLSPRVPYSYTVRVAWVEDGKLVSETHDFPVKAGDVHCVYLVQAGSKVDGTKEVVKGNLAKLSPEDRKLAEAQQYCAVQNGVRLGAMGTPVKVTLDGETVLLCCDSCMAHAKAHSAHTVEKAKDLKSKSNAPPSK
jgi:uncharacterized protein (TIGR03000 family)